MINKFFDFIGNLFFDIPDEALYYEENLGEDVRPYRIRESKDDE